MLLSPAGIEKTRNVMTLQDVLASQGNMPGQRSSERFSFAVFGTPAETGAWGFRLEGHHLHQSISVRDNRIVSVTPSSFSVNPNRVTSGKHAGLVTLRGEEALARKLYGDLNPKLQGRARLSATPMNNIMSYAGRERANAQGVGVPAAELASAQRDLVWQLVDTYAADYLAPALAEAQRARVRDRRSRGRAFRLVRAEHRRARVRLSRHRVELRDRARLGRSGRAASAHDLSRPRQRARTHGLNRDDPALHPHRRRPEHRARRCRQRHSRRTGDAAWSIPRAA